MDILTLLGTAVAETAENDPAVVEEVIDAVDTATTVANKVIWHLPIFVVRLLESGLVILISILALQIGKRIIAWLLRHEDVNTGAKLRRIKTLKSIITSVYKYLLFFIMAAVIMTLFGINVKAIWAMASIGGVTVGFASQTLIKDIIYGLFIWSEGSIGIGDIVKINDMDGVIDSITLRTTVIHNYNGDVYTIPNGEIRIITNLSAGNKHAVVDIPCPYDMNQTIIVGIIQDEITRAVSEIEGIRGEANVLNIQSFEHNAVLVRITVACKASDYRRIEREIRACIKNRFDKEGIIMPHFSGCMSGKT